VRVVEGSGLKIPWRFYHPDVYCYLGLGMTESKTTIAKKTHDPVWNHVCEFPVTEADMRTCYLKLNALGHA
jgi:Ca2+-dependent lipid-binding protein